ncbi:uncharacterized protein LOC135484852 [Lineus longissimus]|uniref:uncharacterized protein LOC135484852 n=1 Tax=Lineus longissimus TaxID=88925 RepID=UPI00315DD31C
MLSGKKCPNLSVKVGRRCVIKKQKIRCPRGFENYNGRCRYRCPRKFYRKGNLCLRTTNLDYRCPKGTDQKGKLCVYSPAISCKKGYDLYRLECLPKCPLGYSRLGRICKKTDAKTAVRKSKGGPKAPVNLALRMKAWQSTTAKNAVAGRAVDGNKNTNFKKGTCTRTKDINKYHHWWAVDMTKPQTVQEVVLTNRGDCCGDRLEEFEILVTNKRPGPMMMRSSLEERCANQDKPMKKGQTFRFKCRRPMQGRYVVIWKEDNKTPLTLCEVEVYGVGGQDAGESKSKKPHKTKRVKAGNAPAKNKRHPDYAKLGPNLAQGKKAKQSSTVNNGVASRAVDGKRNSDFSKGSCTMTKTIPDNKKGYHWWRVDLGRSRKVSVVYIMNRVDCCANRLHKFEVLVTNSDPSDGDVKPISTNTCVSRSAPMKAGEGRFFRCKEPVSGRYVIVRKRDRTSSLTLCEVEVYSGKLKWQTTTPKVTALTNLAKNKKAYQSSTLNGAVAGRAVDGNKSTTLQSKSCSATQNTARHKHWWAVDLGRKYKVKSVKIANYKNLVNFEVAVSNKLPNAATFKIDRNDRCYYSVSALKKGKTKSFSCYRPMVGRFVVIRKKDRKTPLALCEVEVYGENLPSG